MSSDDPSAPSAPNLTEADAAFLSRAPVLVFLLVAAADGNIDKEEVAEFQNCCSQALEKPGGSLLRSAISVAADHMEEMIALCIQSDHCDQLATMRDLLESKIDPDRAFEFKAGLLMLGRQIANASSGDLPAAAGNIDDAEKKALAGLIDALDIDMVRLGQKMKKG
ncbi:MAG: hypothetical protein ACI8XO_001467 [Verrucomicrobiales bacterium]|jgi:hypothetical protein